MFLVDTNVWLEILLGQEKRKEANQFVSNTEARFLAISEFSLYSIGIILTKLKKDKLFEDFITDTVEDSGVVKLHLDTSDFKELLNIIRQFKLDFDDAYQYVAAIKYGYTLVSFDSDFDRTKLGRKTPEEVLP